MDFTVLATNFGTGQDWANGDYNYDGKVNALDFNALAANFGQTIVAPADPIAGAGLSTSLGTLVPEPGSFGFLALGAIALLRRKRHCLTTTQNNNM